MVRPAPSPYPDELRRERRAKKELEEKVAQLSRTIELLEKEVEEYKTSERFLRVVIDGIQDPVYVKDHDSRITFANEALARVVGKPVSEIVGRTDSEYYSDSDVGRVLREHDLRVMESGQGYSVEEQIPTPDGVRTFTSAKIPYRDASGHIVGIIGVSRDVTERKEAGEKLRESALQLSEAADIARIVYWEHDVETGEFVLNDAFYSLFATTAEREGGYRMAAEEHGKRFVHPGDLEELTRQVAKNKAARSQAGDLERYEHRGICRDGKVIHILTRSRIVKDPEGRVLKVVGVSQDITERKKAEDALRESETKLRAILESSRDAIGVSQNGIQTFANPAYVSLFGYDSVDELIGASTIDLIAPESRGLVKEITKKRAAGEPVPTFYEVTTLRKDGTTFLAEITVSTYVLKGERFTLSILRDITERKRAEEALRESEALLASFLEYSPVYVFFKDKDTRPLRLSKNYEQLLGMPVSQALGKTMDELFPSDLAKSMVEADLLALNGGQRVDVVEEFGGRLYETTKFPIFRDGRPDVLAGFTVDITERKQVEERRELMNRVLATLNSPHEIQDLTPRILLLLKEHLNVEAAAIRLRSGDDFPYVESIGFPQGFLDAENYLCIRDDHDAILRDGSGKPELACLCGHVITGHADGFCEFFTEKGSFRTNNAADFLSFVKQENPGVCLRGRCMSEGYQSIALIPLRSGEEIVGLLQFEDKQPDRFMGVEIEFLEDLAATIGIALLRKESEDRTRASEERFSRIFKRSADCIALTRMADSRFVDVNDAWTRAFGYTREHAVGKRGVDLGLWKSLADRARCMAELEEKGEVRNFEVTLMKASEEATYLMFGTVVELGGEQCVLWELRDITDRKHLEDQLRQAQKMEAVGTLAGGVAHDFNNILTVISGYSHLIREEIGANDHLRPYVDQVITSSERAADLTQRLLAFSRKQRITLAPHNINDIVRGTAKLLNRLLTEDIELKLDLTDAEVTAHVDVSHIDQVLMNLAVNARDAMPHGGSLTITTGVATLGEEFCKIHGFGRPGEYASLSASDTGTGMDEVTMKRIFDPFFTTKEVGKGTGLGLASVYGTVKQHDGYITVKSTLSKGTTFDIYLPLLDAPHQQKAAPAAETRRGTETVLIAEDDPGVRNMFSRILENHGYTVMQAVDGHDAIRVYKENREGIDLIILDVVMPGKNGKETLDEIARINSRAKGIFVSGYTGDIVIDKGVQSESVDFIQKPVSVTTLLAKVREVLDRPSLELSSGNR